MAGLTGDDENGSDNDAATLLVPRLQRELERQESQDQEGDGDEDEDGDETGNATKMDEGLDLADKEGDKDIEMADSTHATAHSSTSSTSTTLSFDSEVDVLTRLRILEQQVASCLEDQPLLDRLFNKCNKLELQVEKLSKKVSRISIKGEGSRSTSTSVNQKKGHLRSMKTRKVTIVSASRTSDSEESNDSGDDNGDLRIPSQIQDDIGIGSDVELNREELADSNRSGEGGGQTHEDSEESTHSADSIRLVSNKSKKRKIFDTASDSEVEDFEETKGSLANQHPIPDSNPPGDLMSQQSIAESCSQIKCAVCNCSFSRDEMKLHQRMMHSRTPVTTAKTRVSVRRDPPPGRKSPAKSKKRSTRDRRDEQESAAEQPVSNKKKAEKRDRGSPDPEPVSERKCPECKQVFSAAKHMKRHLISIHHPPTLKCGFCDRPFNRKDKMKNHQLNKHGKIYAGPKSESLYRVVRSIVPAAETADSDPEDQDEMNLTPSLSTPIPSSSSRRSKVTTAAASVPAPSTRSRIRCPQGCGQSFRFRFSLSRHLTSCQKAPEQPQSSICPQNYVSGEELREHESSEHPPDRPEPLPEDESTAEVPPTAEPIEDEDGDGGEGNGHEDQKQSDNEADEEEAEGDRSSSSANSCGVV